MKIELLSNTKNKDISISNDVFSKEFNESLIHQAVVSFMASSRQGSAKQKNRSEVRGGGKKPYRQKGTGRARAGTIRSPLWRGGGVTFASRPRDFSKKINKKMYRAAIKSIFSELVRQNRLVAILIITDELDMNLYLSARNIPNVDVITVREINPINLLKPQKVAVTGEALKQIEEWING